MWENRRGVMKTVIYTCDICKKKIEIGTQITLKMETTVHTSISQMPDAALRRGVQTEKDLCYTCADDMYSFMKKKVRK
jgi:hypothetical protein